ncbi:SDR family NAD(P)-dependent oxidoreductase [Cohnella sp. GbtcB17]|uniref:SDR family oxidoreductase n=1 Tax=Cohnella sp. GbtcB17 TaxID=2824762 RepID=UPI001C2F200A|nr:SDR family NAD(P)-dependent oxidoreductase [Cohnella sp. GbtcB17]
MANAAQAGAGNGDLAGKVALVTGAASGIGLASAVRLARDGAKVALLGRGGDDELAQAVHKIAEAGGEAIPVEADISVEADMQAAVQKVLDTWGRLDIVVANAGINGVLLPIEDMGMDDWNTTIGINLTGTFLTVKYAVPALKKQGGSIIITSSINGNRVFSNFGFSAYSTSKAGQVAFMQMAALELAKYRIRVNAICPGAIETNIGENTDRRPEVDEIAIPVEFPEGDQPLRHKPGSAKQVASLVKFLASDESSHITGTPIYIDGAESLIHG